MKIANLFRTFNLKTKKSCFFVINSLLLLIIMALYFTINSTEFYFSRIYMHSFSTQPLTHLRARQKKGLALTCISLTPYTTKIYWCRRGELNPHLRKADWILSPKYHPRRALLIKGFRGHIKRLDCTGWGLLGVCYGVFLVCNQHKTSTKFRSGR